MVSKQGEKKMEVPERDLELNGRKPIETIEQDELYRLIHPQKLDLEYYLSYAHFSMVTIFNGVRRKEKNKNDMNSSDHK